MPADLVFYSNPMSKVPTERQTMIGYGTFESTIDALERAVRDKYFIVGNRFSAADLYVGSKIDAASMPAQESDRP